MLSTTRDTDKSPVIVPKCTSNNDNDVTPRFAGPSLNNMTPEQNRLYKDITKSRPRTGISGPFQIWLSTPKICKPAQELGKMCRYHTSLSTRESEIVILLTASRMQSSTEFDIHAKEALVAGVEEEIISAIKQENEHFTLEKIKSSVVTLLQNQREIAIVEFVAEMLESNTVCEETYNNAKSMLDNKEEVLVEITSIVGYYMYVALTLNVFRIPP